MGAGAQSHFNSRLPRSEARRRAQGRVRGPGPRGAEGVPRRGPGRAPRWPVAERPPRHPAPGAEPARPGPRHREAVWAPGTVRAALFTYLFIFTTEMGAPGR